MTIMQTLKDLKSVISVILTDPSNQGQRLFRLMVSVLWQVYKRLFSFPVLLPLDNGRYYLADPAAGNSVGIIYTRIYESQYIEFSRRDILQGGWGVDVGAHTGLYTLLLSQCFSKIICFEPDPETMALLSRNICLNNLPAIPITSAISNQSGIMKFRRIEQYSGTARLMLEAEQEGNAEIIEVKVQTLDEVAEAMGMTNLKFLKIDTEGNELNVLTGARRILSANPECLVVYENSCTSDILEFFLNLKWTVFGIDKFQNIRTDHEDIFYANNLFACGPSHPLYRQVNQLRGNHASMVCAEQ